MTANPLVATPADAPVAVSLGEVRPGGEGQARGRFVEVENGCPGRGESACAL